MRQAIFVLIERPIVSALLLSIQILLSSVPLFVRLGWTSMSSF